TTLRHRSGPRWRLHQRGFRERVLRAYQQCCAICRLRHDELLEAAHILPDGHPRGEPVIPNGLALCKLHHAAFDAYIIGVTLERAIQIAASAHQRQFDQGGSPYFLHPLRVMLRLKSEPDRIVAVLHDVLEDTAWTAAQLVEEGFAPGVMTALDALCRRKDES